MAKGEEIPQCKKMNDSEMNKAIEGPVGEQAIFAQ